MSTFTSFFTINALPKCRMCKKDVCKQEEISLGSFSYHLSVDCFRCGLGESDGCGKSLGRDNYSEQTGIPFCSTCSAKNFSYGIGVLANSLDTIPEATAAAPVTRRENLNLPSVDLDRAQMSAEKVAANVDASKCPNCQKSVYKAEQLLALGCTWHKSCFCCGGVGEGGCKRILTQDGYQQHQGVAYCTACFNHQFKSAGSRRAILGAGSVSPTVPFEGSSLSDDKEELNVVAAAVSVADRSNAFKLSTAAFEDSSSQSSVPQRRQSVGADRFRNTAIGDSNKCPACTKTVYKAEELLALGTTWHKLCFCCGGTGEQGCKRVLTQESYEQQAGVAYCTACFARMFKQGAAKGAITSYPMSAINSPDASSPIASASQDSDELSNSSFASRASSFRSAPTSDSTKPSIQRRPSVAADRFRSGGVGDSNKCPACTKSVYKAEELLAMGTTWHKLCFCCGGTGEQGCKRVLTQEGYQQQGGVAYCAACFARLFKKGGAQGTFISSTPSTPGEASTHDLEGLSISMSVPSETSEEGEAIDAAQASTTRSAVSVADRSATFRSTTTSSSSSSSGQEAHRSSVSRRPSVAADRFRSGGVGDSNKCPACTKSVYKAEELLAMGTTWHKLCFCCGGTGEQGCKRVLTQEGYQQQGGVAYCAACFARLFKQGAAKGVILSTSKAIKSSNSADDEDDGNAAAEEEGGGVGGRGGNGRLSANNIESSGGGASSINSSGGGSSNSTSPVDRPASFRFSSAADDDNVNDPSNSGTRSDSSTTTAAAGTRRPSTAADKFRNPAALGGLPVTKCPACSNTVYKAEELLALGTTWHKLCFCCGGTGEQGCKRVLTQDGYEQQAGVAYCTACFARMFKQGAAKGAVLKGNADQSTTSATHLADSVTPVTAAATTGASNAATLTGAVFQPISESTGIARATTSGSFARASGSAGMEQDYRDLRLDSQSCDDDNSSIVSSQVSATTTSIVELGLVAVDKTLAEGTHRSVPLVYHSDFDENGVLYWIGTNGKTRGYRNPHAAGLVEAEMSTTFRGAVHSIVGRIQEGTSNYTENSQNSWVRVDLGPGRFLMPNYYSIRHGGSSKGNSLLNWKLQAKVGETDDWITLKRHVNDTSIDGTPNSSGSWPIYLPPEIQQAIHGFRIFRVSQFGLNSGGNNCLFCAGLEFYGTLVEEIALVDGKTP